jgi:hypothetical protein
MSRRQRRKSQALTTGFSPTFIPELNRRIEHSLHEWHAVYESEFNSETSHKLFVEECFRRLQSGRGTLDAARIVEFARAGFPAAHEALRDCIDIAMAEDKFQELAMPIREYARWTISRTTAPPTKYPSNGSQVVNHFVRDINIHRAINWVVARWPFVPPLYSSPRWGRSAAYLVGAAFELEEDHARRIYRERGELAKRFQAFMASYRILPA